MSKKKNTNKDFNPKRAGGWGVEESAWINFDGLPLQVEQS